MAKEVNVTEFLGLTGIDQMKGGFGGAVDVKKTIDQARSAIKPLLKDISDAFAKIGKDLKKDLTSVASDGSTTSTGTKNAVDAALARTASATVKSASASTSGSASSSIINAVSSGGGTKMLGGFMKGGGMAAAGTAIVGGINMGINAANQRFARGREGVLEADRMSVLYQQMTGLDQLGVSSTYRMPLTNYRLGAGGINQLMAMEAQTGLSGRQQASSVEAMRTISGYQLGTGDVTSMMGSLMSAPTANRLFMMTGTGIIGPGGKQNSMMNVMQGIVRSAGLTDKETLKNAMLPGSVTRAKLTAMGVPVEMQTEVIQYAQQNLTYKEKGGKGMYDPSQKGARRLMGIEENFATQVEETQRLETKRDEQFYRRQVDNYANLERQTQTLTRAFGALEDKLSGILGFVGQNRIATSVFQGILPGGGDPDGNSVGVNTAAPNVRSAMNNSNFKQLHPTMQSRVLKMLAANPKVGFGGGFRSSSSQREMFMSRYRKTDKETNSSGKKNIYWDGSYWEHVSGAAAAPPGRSMHEIGLAVDLTGDFDWVTQNAHKFGLKHFGGVNNEPWHVQPEELPNSRAKYEESGAPWGHGTGNAAPFSADSDFGESLDHPSGTAGSIPQRGYRDLSIADRVERSVSVGSGSGVNGVGVGNNQKKYGKVKSSAGTPITFGDFKGAGTARSGVDVNRWAQDFLREVGAPVTLANMEAISAWIQAENTRAQFNPLAVVSKPTAEAMGGNGNLTGWTEFNHNGGVPVLNFANYEQGLKMNAYHVKNHGKGVVKALQSNTNNPYDIITAIEKMVSGWAPNYAARDVLESRGVPTSVSGDPSGDPHIPTLGSGGGSTSAMSFTGGTTFNISPNIVMSGSGSPQDLQRIAKEVAALIRKEIELQALRRS